MANDIVRRGKIILDLETGKAELNAPALDGITKAKEKQLKLDEQIEQQNKRYWAAREGASFKAEQAFAKANRSSLQQITAVNEAGEGFFRLGRAAVLLGVDSDESFQKMIASLAKVQAYFDLYRGTAQIFAGFGRAVMAARDANIALAIAEGQAATAAEAAALGHASYAAALGTVIASAATLAGVVVTLASVLSLGITAWDHFTESEEEAAEKAKLIADAIKKVTDAMEVWASREREIKTMRREAMSDAQKEADLYKSRFQIGGIGAEVFQIKNTGGPEEAALLSFQRKRAMEVASDIKEEIALRRKAVESQQQQIDKSIEQIEAQDKLVDAARKQVEAEQQKLRSAQAQFGQLTAIEQQQIKATRDKLRAGQEITAYEEEQFSKIGGGAAGVIENRRSKRGMAAGYGEDFLEGLEGAGMGVKGAADELKKVVEALNRLTDGLSAGEAVAKLEAEKAQLQKQLTEFEQVANRSLNRIIDVIAAIDKRLAEIEKAALLGPR